MRSVRIVLGCVLCLAGLSFTPSAHAHPYTQKKEVFRSQRDPATSRYFRYENGRPTSVRSVSRIPGGRVARGCVLRTST